MVGKTISHYRILEKIGEGGMGVVYKARDTDLDRLVALKFLHSSEDVPRLLREAKTAAALNHPNICAVHEVNLEHGFIAIELVEGQSLAARIGGRPLPVEEAVGLAVQICEGLKAAHDKGITHRDIKSGNVLVTTDGHAKILDFGLARVAGQTALTWDGAAAGTPGYMAPEQMRGEPADRRTDIWAVGAVLHEMLTGRLPMGQAATLPEGLGPIVRKALAADPGNRYQHIEDLLVDLRALAKPSAVHVAPRRLVALALAGVGLIAVAVIGLNGGGLRDRLLTFAGGRPGAPLPKIESLAVLPVRNFSGDPSQDFFADGMTDTLIASLAQIKAVKVISLTSVMRYKDAKKPLPQIARELGVDGIVEASVMRSGGRVRITAQLLEARQDRHLWASNYERDLTDVLALQSEVVQAIAGEIRAQLTPQESKRLKAARSVDPEVYDLVLKGKATLEYATREEQIRQAVTLFQKAVDRDPTYAPAWAGLGESLWTLASRYWEFVAPGEVRAKAIAAVEKALELDGNLPEAHKARAVIAFDGEWDAVKAEQHFQRAIELRPGYAAAESLYAQLLMTFLRFEEARRHMDRARELDPLSPWNDLNLLGWWFYQGQPEKVIEEAAGARQRNPTVYAIPIWTGFARFLLGQPDQAAAELETALKLASPERPLHVIASLAFAYGLAGRRTDALKILAEMERGARKQYVCSACLAGVYSSLGRMDEGFQLLNQALEERNTILVMMTGKYPVLNVFRRDPRFKPFVERLRKAVRLPPGAPNPY